MGVLLNGTSDFYLRGGDLTGILDGKEGMLSVWLRLDGGDGGMRRIFIQDQALRRVRVSRNSANKLEFFLRDPSGIVLLDVVTVASFVASSAHIHLLASWNLSATTFALYVDDAAESLTFNTGPVDGTIDYTASDWSVGANTAGGERLNGALSEFYFTTEYRPLSVEANRRKFITADGTPANLGADGSLPTGTAPLVCLSGGKDAFPINRGTGGSFSVGGGAPTTVPFPAPEDTRARTRHRLGADYYR